MGQSGLLVSFLGALQASLSVLLTISSGVVASRLRLLKAPSARDISKTCVRLFLPALLITNVGQELHGDTIGRYVPVLIWSLVTTLFSMGLGWSLKRLFKFPAWTIPAICFNNTTAMPLLLIQSLESAGILKDLMKDTDKSTSDTVKRAKSYFLIASMVGNSLTFALGPKLLDDEEAPDSEEETKEEDEEDDQYENPRNFDGNTTEDEEALTEETSLLPRRLERPVARASRNISSKTRKLWSKLPDPVRSIFSHIGEFLNAPLFGALVGAFIGMIPPFHKAFFSEPEEGGILKAWLTQSISNIGELFATLQLVVVGAKLNTCLSKAQKGEDSGKVPLPCVLTIFFIRFLLWPAVSISVILLLASKTQLLENDPVLWFVMMLLPTGPPATKLTALADVSDADEEQKMAISKFLAISYAFSPFICVAVVGSLKACQAIQGA